MFKRSVYVESSYIERKEEHGDFWMSHEDAQCLVDQGGIHPLASVWIPSDERSRPTTHVHWGVIWCKCGYHGGVSLLKKEEEAKQVVFRRFEDRDEVNEIAFVSDGEPVIREKLVAVCPQCESEPDIDLMSRAQAPHIVVDYARVYDNREKNGKISLSIGGSRYYYNWRAAKLGYSQVRLRLTHNTKTGFTYVTQGAGKIRNVSYGGGFNHIESSFNQLLRAFLYECKDNKVYEGQLFEFIDLCWQARGLKYVDYRAFFPDLKEDIYRRIIPVSCLTTVFLYLRHPNLQSMPHFRWGWMPPELRKPLIQAGEKSARIWKVLFGHTSKAVRKRITTTHAFRMIAPWALVLKEPSNLIRLLDADEHAEQRGRGLSNISVFAMGPKRERGDQEVINALEFVRSLHQDENHFLRRVLRIEREKLAFQIDFDDEEGLAPEKEFMISHAEGIILDTHRIYLKIKERDPNYELVYRNDIEQLHDDLSKDFERMRHENCVIPYTKKEQSWEGVYRDYEFKLAPDTHSLIDIGKDMNICVGSYGDMAVSKQCTIVYVTYKADGVNDSLSICLEIRGDRLEQAKLHHNEMPNKEQSEIIKAWCEEHQINWKNCYDLKSGAQEFHVDVVADLDPIAEPFF